MATSMSMCLRSLGYGDLDEDTVNRVMGAQPMRAFHSGLVMQNVMELLG